MSRGVESARPVIQKIITTQMMIVLITIILLIPLVPAAIPTGKDSCQVAVHVVLATAYFPTVQVFPTLLVPTQLVAETQITFWALAFGLFRLFDIWKPWPIRDLDHRLAGGVGIMLDDLVAALYAAILLALGGWLIS